jgi:hypothetical protein
LRDLREGVLREFSEHRQGVGYDDVGLRVVGPAQREDRAAVRARAKRWRHKVERELRAARAACATPAIAPLPRVSCPVCGATFGSEIGVARHRRRAHT